MSNLQLLRKIEKTMDDLNAEHGIKTMLCIFCKSNNAEYIGVMHKNDCLLEEVRDAVRWEESVEEA